MKTWKVYSLALFFVTVSFSCRKKTYPPELTIENDVVFYSMFNLDGSPQKLEGGKNNYYMYSSYSKDSNNIFNFIADLKQLNCQSKCTNSIRIQINDYKTTVAPGLFANIDSSLRFINYTYLTGIIESNHVVSFLSSFNKNAASYKWDFGDGTFSELANPSHNYKRDGKYNVCLTTTSDNGCYSTICNNQNISSKNSLKSRVIHSLVSGNTVSFSQSTIGGKEPYKFLWNFGDGRVDTVSNPVHQYSLVGAYPVILKVTDANNEIVVINYNVNTISDGSSCSANYFISNDTYSPVGYALSKVIINWTNPSGIVYTSANVNQPESSFFKIVSVEDFHNNEAGQMTKKLHVRFKCKVYNGTEVHSIDDGDAFICVAYK